MAALQITIHGGANTAPPPAAMPWANDPVASGSSAAAAPWANDPVVGSAPTDAPTVGGSIGTFANHMATDIPVIGPLLQGATDWGIGAIESPFTGVSPGDFVQHEQDYRARQTAANPGFADAGGLVGNGLAATMLGGTTLGAQALGLAGDLIPRAVNSATSYMGATTADNMVRGQSPLDAVKNAALQGPTIPFTGLQIPGPVIAALLPALGTMTSRGIQQATTSPEARVLASKFAADGISPADVNSRLGEMGPAAVVADLGPNLQAKAAGLATSPGEAQKIVAEAMAARQQAGNARVKASVNDTLGEAPVPSSITSGIQAAKQSLSPEYQTVLRNKAMSQNFAMDAAPLGDQIAHDAAGTVGHTRTQLQRVQQMLIDPATGRYTQDPGIILATRHELDGMIGAENNSTTKGYLTGARHAIDDALAAQVPGLKAVDGQFSQLARFGEAFDAGHTVLNQDVHPADIANSIIQGSSNENAFRTAGLRAKIDSIIGNNANDRVSLARILKGEGSWNRDKLALQFGADRADRLIRLLDNEAKMAATETQALRGSRTAPLLADQAETRNANPGVVKSLLNIRAGDIYDSLKERLLGGAFEERQAGINSKVAEAIMRREFSGPLARQVGRINGAQSLSPAIQKVGQAMLMAGSHHQ